MRVAVVPFSHTKSLRFTGTDASRYAMYSCIKEVNMSSVKEKMTEIIRSQPDDASYEEL